MTLVVWYLFCVGLSWPFGGPRQPCSVNSIYLLVYLSEKSGSRWILNENRSVEMPPDLQKVLDTQVVKSHYWQQTCMYSLTAARVEGWWAYWHFQHRYVMCLLTVPPNAATVAAATAAAQNIAVQQHQQQQAASAVPLSQQLITNAHGQIVAIGSAQVICYWQLLWLVR